MTPRRRLSWNCDSQNPAREATETLIRELDECGLNLADLWETRNTEVSALAPESREKVFGKRGQSST
jgi:hypothetical protein